MELTYNTKTTEELASTISSHYVEWENHLRVRASLLGVSSLIFDERDAKMATQLAARCPSIESKCLSALGWGCENVNLTDAAPGEEDNRSVPADDNPGTECSDDTAVATIDVDSLSRQYEMVQSFAIRLQQAWGILAFGLSGANLSAVMDKSPRDGYLALKAMHKSSLVFSQRMADRKLRDLQLTKFDSQSVERFLTEHRRLIDKRNTVYVGPEHQYSDMNSKLDLVLKLESRSDETWTTKMYDDKVGYDSLVKYIMTSINLQCYKTKYGATPGRRRNARTQ